MKELIAKTLEADLFSVYDGKIVGYYNLPGVPTKKRGLLDLEVMVESPDVAFRPEEDAFFFGNPLLAWAVKEGGTLSLNGGEIRVLLPEGRGEVRASRVLPDPVPEPAFIRKGETPLSLQELQDMLDLAALGRWVAVRPEISFVASEFVFWALRSGGREKVVLPSYGLSYLRSVWGGLGKATARGSFLPSFSVNFLLEKGGFSIGFPLFTGVPVPDVSRIVEQATGAPGMGHIELPRVPLLEEGDKLFLVFDTPGVFLSGGETSKFTLRVGVSHTSSPQKFPLQASLLVKALGFLGGAAEFSLVGRGELPPLLVLRNEHRGVALPLSLLG